MKKGGIGGFGLESGFEKVKYLNFYYEALESI